MSYDITQAQGGFYLRIDSDNDHAEPVQRHVFAELRDLLCFLVDELSDSEDNSRYSEKRIYIIEAPGDKHEDFTKDHSKQIFGDDSDCTCS